MKKDLDQEINRGKKDRQFKFQRVPERNGVVLSSAAQVAPFFKPLGLCTIADSAPPFTNFGPGARFLELPPLKTVHVQLIFWGSAWAGTLNALATQITSSVQNILAGSYMTYLAQYGVGRGTLLGTSFFTGSDPPNDTWFDSAGNPIGSGFNEQDFSHVSTFIQRELDVGGLPEPYSKPPIFYCVIMPPTASFYDTKNPPNTRGVVGENWFAWWWPLVPTVGHPPAPIHIAWVGNDGTVDYVTNVLSHELVEVCTDPFGSLGGGGIRKVGCTDGSCQIGDPCTGTCDYVNGIKVQGYWSQVDKKCITPNWYSVKRTLYGRDFSRGIGGSLQPHVPIPSLRTLVASLF